MESVLRLIKDEDLRRLVSGVFDVGEIPVDKQYPVCLMAAHCCVNGPVGTNRQTTFPLVAGEVSVNTYLGKRISNNSWKSFCLEVAAYLKAHHMAEIRSCQQIRVMGDLWPLVASISEARKNQPSASG